MTRRTMTTKNDNRPSIAELKTWCGEPDRDEADGSYACRRCRCTMVLNVGYEPSPLCNACAQWLVSDAALVLLEIVAAALAFHRRWQAAEFEDDTKPARQELFAALAKVRP